MVQRTGYYTLRSETNQVGLLPRVYVRVETSCQLCHKLHQEKHSKQYPGSGCRRNLANINNTTARSTTSSCASGKYRPDAHNQIIYKKSNLTEGGAIFVCVGMHASRELSARPPPTSRVKPGHLSASQQTRSKQDNPNNYYCGDR